LKLTVWCGKERAEGWEVGQTLPKSQSLSGCSLLTWMICPARAGNTVCPSSEKSRSFGNGGSSPEPSAMVVGGMWMLTAV
jgi:hypothetical protein